MNPEIQPTNPEIQLANPEMNGAKSFFRLMMSQFYHKSVVRQ